jgi:alanine-glyoxylate transaminase/serine-glyoxylate transaminase/serine-pyruvate transaminase
MKSRNLLMIPGPVEFEPAVLLSLGAPTPSHLDNTFIEVFSLVLTRMRTLFACPDGQPLVLAGSGTLAMDSAAANLVEPGDRALVINTGYFSDRFGTILERYGASVTHLRAVPGGCPTLEEIELELKSGGYKLVTVTHVDTSTAVLVDVKSIARLTRQYAALLVVDGVCSVGGEELRMTEWGVDVTLTASQKAVGVPPGLGLLMVRPPALAALQARKTPVTNYYADWNNWISVMQAYEARKPAYFATPPINHIFALNTSLEMILSEGMEARWQRHERLSRACRAGLKAIGLEQVPLKQKLAAHTVSAPRYPKGVDGSDFLARVAKAGVTLASGLHPDIRSEYFRIGHMGSVSLGDILAVLGAVESGLHGCGHVFTLGSSASAAIIQSRR